MQVCRQPGCPSLVTGGYCDAHDSAFRPCCAICYRRGWLARAARFDIDLGLSLCESCNHDVERSLVTGEPLPGCDAHGRTIDLEL